MKEMQLDKEHQHRYEKRCPPRKHLHLLHPKKNQGISSQENTLPQTHPKTESRPFFSAQTPTQSDKSKHNRSRKPHKERHIKKTLAKQTRFLGIDIQHNGRPCKKGYDRTGLHAPHIGVQCHKTVLNVQFVENDSAVSTPQTAIKLLLYFTFFSSDKQAGEVYRHKSHALSSNPFWYKKQGCIPVFFRCSRLLIYARET